MSWIRLSDTLHSHPKRWRVGLPELGLWAVCLSWSGGSGLDGFLPAPVVASQGGSNARKLADRLVKAGFWEPATHPEYGSGWQIHGWAEYNISQQEWAETRRKNREKVARHRGTKT